MLGGMNRICRSIHRPLPATVGHRDPATTLQGRGGYHDPTALPQPHKGCGRIMTQPPRVTEVLQDHNNLCKVRRHHNPPPQPPQGRGGATFSFSFFSLFKLFYFLIF